LKTGSFQILFEKNPYVLNLLQINTWADPFKSSESCKMAYKVIKYSHYAMVYDIDIL